MEHWKAEPSWWKIPFGDWPGDSTVSLDARARVIYSVPFEADWTFRVQDGFVEVIAPWPTVEAVELQTAGVVCTYNHTSWRYDSKQMEDKLRSELLAGMRERAGKRIPTSDLQEKAAKGIEAFVREFVLVVFNRVLLAVGFGGCSW